MNYQERGILSIDNIKKPEIFDELENIICNPSSFLFLERYVNRGSYHAYALYSEVSTKYRPVDGDPSFDLPYLVLPYEQVVIAVANPNKNLAEWILRDGKIKFFVHPDMVAVHQRSPERSLITPEIIQSSVKAQPTASTRTMVVNADGLPPFMIKTDLEKVISRFVRELDRTRVQFSLEISRALQQTATNPEHPPFLGFLPETLGSWLEFSDGHSIGYLVREMTPRPEIDESETFIPFFALFSPNKKNPSCDLLIYQIIDNIMRKKQINDPSEALLKYVFKPCLESWAYLVYDYGILPERHAQNGLLSLDSEGIPIRVIDRDFQGFNVDLTTRRTKGLSTKFCHHVVEPEKRGVVLSRCYDHRMGFQVFDPILKVVELRYGNDTRFQTQESIRQLFYELTPPEFLEIFPKEQYGLDNTTMFRDQPTADVAKSQPPTYR